MDFHGVFPPVPTPFRDDEVDLDALRGNLRRLLASRLAGVVVLGSNGEAAFVDEDESVAVVAAAREVVPRDRLLVAGTGRESTRAAVLATRRAAEAGADAVLVRAPSFFKAQMTADAFVRHYRTVADASPVPVLLYNFTALTGVTIPPAAVAELSAHPNILGMKESGNDVALLAEYVAHGRPGFAVLAGSGRSFFAGLTVGAVGAILAIAVVVPDLCVQVFDLVAAGRAAEACELQRRLLPFAHTVTTRFGVAGLKVAQTLVGQAGGLPRGPLLPAPPEAEGLIRRQLNDLAVA
jgi:4-hydroxy-2-oxoglutarate aldolase